MIFRRIFPLLALPILILAPACRAQEGEPIQAATPAATSAPTQAQAVPTAASLDESYTSLVGGYAFQQIPGWETEAFLGLASMQPPAADERSGPGILLVGGQHSRPLDLAQAYDSLTDEFRDQSFGDLALDAPYETTLAGFPARAAGARGLENGVPLTGRLLVVLVSPEQSFFAFGFATQSAWETEVQGAFEALLASVRFFDPLPLDSQGGESGRPPEPAAPTPTSSPPDETLWRLGGPDAPDFAHIAGLAADSSGFVYTAERGNGIRIFDPQGQPIGQIQPEGARDFDSLALSESGGGVIAGAAWGSSWLTVMDFSGQVMVRFGRQGEGPGEFGNEATLALALDRDNRIYVLGSSVLDGLRRARLQIFDTAGTYQGEWRLDGSFIPQAIAFHPGPEPDGDRIFLLGGGEIRAYDLSGVQVGGGIGAHALRPGEPRALALDAAGHFYLAMLDPAQVLQLDPAGNLLAAIPLDGGLGEPTAIAVSPDGSRVYLSTQAGINQAYLSAFEFK